MFTKQELEKYAEVMFWGMRKARKHPFAPGDIVLIRSDLSCIPLAHELFRKFMDQRYYPVLRITPPEEVEKTYFSMAEDFQLDFKLPGDRELYSHLNGLVSLLGPESLTHLKDIDPSRIGRFAVAKKYLRDILEARESEGAFGWSLCLYPTAELAAKAGLTLEQYKDQIVRAVYLDRDDPCFIWENIFEQTRRIKDWLDNMDVEYFHVLSQNTDLKVYPGEKRRWVGLSGHNIPSFELFLSPDYRKTQGVFFSDQPSYRSGNMVRGVTLVFKDGRLQEARAEEGEEFLKRQIQMDEGASMVGEFSLTDKRFSRINTFMAHTLYDENFGGENGNSHIALGASYADTYSEDSSQLTPELKQEMGFNDSALHWDLVNTEPKEVHAYLNSGDVLTIYRDGQFTIADV
ncbi:aminopeptidase [Desulfonatronospira sp.]|uniref:aminopeptidase n=1 Tax=Desulfonatronospira sp. TaxID=1962951 RepID=UPI0025BA7E42|nr:aminopeptidase [Desulfonatronospira sp.]